MFFIYNVYSSACRAYGDKRLFGIDVVDPGAVPGASTNKKMGGDTDSTHIIKK